MSYSKPNHSPQTEAELICLANQLAGQNLFNLAKGIGFPPAINLKREKGWVGQLIEKALGAESNSQAEPDFPHLNIELKTLPISNQGIPLETTFVNVINLSELSNITWETSLTRKKLQRVLWIPYEADPSIAYQDRQIGAPLLWSPNLEQAHILQTDWQELTDMLALGEIENVTSYYGQYLQIRPKGANARAISRAIGSEGRSIPTLPRAFYLRTTFTRTLIQSYFIL